ncbi:MAG: DUF4956 domain-containing protein [Lachnospiraceae bacterium]|nr:DUF4956 domain-containing protein [Lachnospiraceae bacterium]
MSNILFASILSNGSITGEGFLLCTVCSVLIGLFIAFLYHRTTTASKSYLMTLALTPAIVELIIMLVNGNLGAGLAVAGAFSLVRFRSAPGTGQEITGIFLAMAAGLCTGMGYLGLGVLFTVGMSVVLLALQHSGLGERPAEERILRVSVPENLDYENIFDDLMKTYATEAELLEVRTAEMGTLYKLTYKVRLKKSTPLKDFLDEIRIRNGNLDVVCGRPAALPGEL